MSCLPPSAKNLSPAYKIRDVNAAVSGITESGSVSVSSVKELDLGRGVVSAQLELPHELFYTTLSQQSGLDIKDDGDLFSATVTAVKGQA